MTTDLAAKLLRLPVEIFESYEYGPGCVSTYTGDIGFGFSGSVSAAVFTYALCATTFQSLRAEFDSPFPELTEFADYMARVATRYAHEMSEEFEAFLVGATPDRNAQTRTRCIKLHYDKVKRVYVFSEIDLDLARSFALIGSNRAALSAKITKEFVRDPQYNPAKAILEEIKQNAGNQIGPIGGSLQRARASQHAFLTLPAWGANGQLDFVQAAGLHSSGEFGRIGNLEIRSPVQNF